ncbi:MAG TPA: hypothetical protein VFJ16_17520 [Longimicrobium sp.]|nr:hypothetical protein [Longimicrobium sp.]
MAEHQTLSDFIALPATQGTRLIDFVFAEVRPGFVRDTWFLVVGGVAPCSNMEVSLVPLVYIQQPDYWGIEVIGTLPAGICTPAMKPFLKTLDITHTLGKIGVEVIGARRHKKIDVHRKWHDPAERES